MMCERRAERRVRVSAGAAAANANAQSAQPRSSRTGLGLEAPRASCYQAACCNLRGALDPKGMLSKKGGGHKR